MTSAVGVCGRQLAKAVLERGDQVVADEVTFTGQSGTTWRYWEGKPLGTPGGSGGVYAAEGPDGTAMAVKVVKKQRPSGALDDRLLRREIDIGKRVADSGSEMLLPVIDAADAGDVLLLVMPLASGALSAASIPTDEAEVVPVLVDIATGLRDLHSIGIIHRDLKPTNVLRHEGRWKLADFGIARDQEIGTQDPTFVGWGSFPYMAPELWELKSPTVKTDLYALRGICPGQRDCGCKGTGPGDSPGIEVKGIRSSLMRNEKSALTRRCSSADRRSPVRSRSSVTSSSAST